MIQKLLNVRFLAALALLGVGMGCNDTPGGVETYPVTGTVTYQGKPESGVVLTFIADGDAGANAGAITDEAGEFSVFTAFDMGAREQGGMLAGTYRVTATKLEKPSFSGNQPSPKNLLPAKYSKPQTTSLTATIVAGQENHIALELK